MLPSLISKKSSKIEFLNLMTKLSDEEQSFILYSYRLGSNKPKKLTDEHEISKELKDKNLAWVHLDANNPQTKKWLEKEISYLDPYIVEALVAEETRPRLTAIGDGALIILRGVNLNEDSDPEDMVSIRMWVDKSRIISLRKRRLKAVSDVEESILSGEIVNAGDFVCKLIDKLFIE